MIGRHVNTVAAHARDLLSFTYYRDTKRLKDKLEEIIKEENKKNDSKIQFMLGASKRSWDIHVILPSTHTILS
jgi:hypothetical protein